jgi:hypothetical protein
MSKEITACQCGKQRRHIKKSFHIGGEVSHTVFPKPATVVSGVRSAGCPKLVIIFKHFGTFFRICVFVEQDECGLEENAHIVLPEVVIEEAVFLHSPIHLIIVAGNLHQ